MAKRLLVFDKKQLQMRCSQYRRLENGHRLSENYTLNKSFRADWYTWIRSYSQREITYPRDRLGAVSGVAKYFSRRLEENGRPAEYLVGLWRDESLERDLRWVITEPGLSYKEMMEALDEEASYCAPSWSWASRNQGVDFLCKGISTTFEVKQCHLPPATSDATVAVKPGSYITLRGKLARTPIKPTDGVAIDLDGGSWQSNVAWEVNSPAFGHIRYYLDWAPTAGDLAEEDALSQLELLLLAKGSARVGRECSGILLLPFESSRGLLYRRVGAFDSDDRDIPWLTDVLESEVTIV
ncbi:hypothetical protein BFW01_g2128 [Lasiodiplodia theobromae]|uniref:Heterokaryon incompatibility domain-containing protein n=1 Tax=Lasiodiplodia theobromae TaxID=45133 RepID=A0A5N5DHV0_9PEZI|nr:hypothetical protein DBV05_g4461 [Lasiodiplodia theobromae]KAF9631266.1 hypothetical protein BFW01_g2128 [Lasiodiplodia theobromae]